MPNDNKIEMFGYGHTKGKAKSPPPIRYIDDGTTDGEFAFVQYNNAILCDRRARMLSLI